MNKVGIFYAYWVHDWTTDFVPLISKAKKLGFDVLEVNAGTVASMDKPALDRLRKAASDEGINLTFCVGFPPDHDLASPDEKARRNGIEYLKKIAENIHYAGGNTVGGIIYSCWPTTLPDGEKDKRPFLERSVKSMREAVKAAEDNDVYFCMEVVNRFEQYLLNTSEEASQYIDMVGSDHAKIMLDTFHMNIEEDTFRGAILTAGKKLGHFHVGEPNRKLPGTGRIPWKEVASALKEVDYQGVVTMEPFLMMGGEVGRDIKVFRNLNIGMDMDAEAARSAKFMKDLLK